MNPKSVKTSNNNLSQFNQSTEVLDSNLKPVNSTEGTVVSQIASSGQQGYVSDWLIFDPSLFYSDSKLWQIVSLIIGFGSVSIFVKTLLRDILLGGGANDNKGLAAYLKKNKIVLVPKVSTFVKSIAAKQFTGAFLFLVISGFLARCTFTEVEQIVQIVSSLYDYFKSFFFKVNTASLPSVAANLVDVTSVPIKDGGLQTVPSMSSTPSEGHEVKQEVKPGLSRKAKIYIGVYICAAIIIFSATGYFPFVILDIYVLLLR